MQLGRYKGTLTSLFHSPELVKDSNNIAKKIQGLSQETVLEFKQTYDLGIISLVLAVPPLGSVIFAVAWILHFVHKEGVDLQVLVASAFTVASYIVTTGMSSLRCFLSVAIDRLTDCRTAMEVP